MADQQQQDVSARMERLSRRERGSGSTRSYSKFVRIMRLALPLAAMVVVAILFLRPGVEDASFVPLDAKTPRIEQENISRNELINPTFESRDKKNNPYKITAERAVQGESNKDLIMLERPIGVMTLDDGVKVQVVSDTGAYRQDTERFFLQGKVFLEHEEGYSLRSDEAHVDLKENFAWSEKDVLGKTPDLSIEAKGVHANGKTGEVIFSGPAKLTLNQGLEGVQR